VHSNHRGGCPRETTALERARHRGGLFEQPVQHPERSVREGEAGGVSPGPAFLIAFVRSLLGTLTSDQVFLAVGRAAKEVGLPREMAELALSSLLGFKDRNNIWPKDFMP